MTMSLKQDNPLDRLTDIELFDVLDDEQSIDVDEKILEERKEELKKVEMELEDVASMFSDINQLLMHQVKKFLIKI